MNDENLPSVYLPGVRQQPASNTQLPNHRPNVSQAQAYDRSLGPDDIQALLMQRLMMGGGAGRETDPRKNSRIAAANQSGIVSLFPGYSVYRCVDEDHKLMREVGKTDQLGHLDQFIVAEHVVQGLVLDQNLSVIDLGKEGTVSRKLSLVPIKTPPLSNMGTLFVEERAVNRSSGRTLPGQPRRAGSLLID